MHKNLKDYGWLVIYFKILKPYEVYVYGTEPADKWSCHSNFHSKRYYWPGAWNIIIIWELKKKKIE